MRGEGIGGTIKDITKRQGLDKIDASVQGQEQADGGFRDSVQSLPIGGE